MKIPSPEVLNRINLDALESKGHELAFSLVKPTCLKVSAALNSLRKEIEELYGISTEEAVAIDMAICRCMARIRDQATHPLRRALIHVCQEVTKE